MRGARSLSVVLVVLLLGGCAARSPRVRLDAEDQFNLAKREFDSGRYQKASESFRRLIFEHPGSAKVDEAQYLIGVCFYNMKDYAQAEAELKHFLLNYPDSPYADNAAYYVGMSFYKMLAPHFHDQTNAKKAVDAFSRFLVKYPESKLVPQVEARLFECRDRLAEKELEIAKLYLKLKKYAPAKLYLEYVISEYPDTRRALEAKRLLEERAGELGRADADTSQAEK